MPNDLHRDDAGRDTAFLIQNMCPVTPKYMIPYFDKMGNPVNIGFSLAADIKKKAGRIVALSKKGIKVTFPDVMKIYTALNKKN